MTDPLTEVIGGDAMSETLSMPINERVKAALVHPEVQFLFGYLLAKHGAGVTLWEMMRLSVALERDAAPAPASEQEGAR